MNLHTLHDPFYQIILPHLFRIETNYTILVHKTVNKRTYEILHNLVSGVFIATFSGSVDQVISCEFDDYMATVNYKRTRQDIMRYFSIEDSVQYLSAPALYDFLIRKGFTPRQAENDIFYDPRDVSYFIEDGSTSFDLKFQYLETYVSSWENMLDNVTNAELFALGLNRPGSLSQHVKEALFPHFDKIFDGLQRISGVNEGPVLEWIRDDRRLSERLFTRLKDSLGNSEISEYETRDLLSVCSMINADKTYKLLSSVDHNTT